MRWGIGPDDTHFLTAFPFPFYNRLSDGDLADLTAFLATLPPVRKPNPLGKRAFFSGARNAVAVAASRFPGPWRLDPQHDAQWNRGAYLVATVGRCGDCHTPKNWWGAADPNLALAGVPASYSGKTAPNITPDRDTGIGSWSEDEIADLLKDGNTPSFDFVGGAMGKIVDFTSQLVDADRRAIAVYLKSLPAIRNGARHDAKKD